MNLPTRTIHMGPPLIAAFLVFLLMLGMPAIALAKKCPDPPCGGGGGGGDDGGGDNTLTPVDTWQWWSGRMSSDDRECWTHAYSPNNGTTTIGCRINDASPDVSLLFQNGDFDRSGKRTELCDLLTSGLVFGDSGNRLTGFEASSATEWNGDLCLDDGTGTTECEIWVRNTAYGYMCHSSELNTQGQCTGERLIILEGVGTGDAAPKPELNPFTVENQAIVMHDMTFSIKAIGRNRTDATCSVDFDSATAPQVIFNTTPR